MAKIAFFVATFLLVLTKTFGSSLDDLERDFWDDLDSACEFVASEIDPTATPELTRSVKMIEFTRFGHRTHDAYPSAARSLMDSPNFDPNMPTVIFAHGFTDSPLLVSGQSFAAAFEAHGKYNVLAIDSSSLIKIFYLRSSAMVKYIGEFLGHFVYDLVKMGVNAEQVMLVGHSLGAHICGFAGKTYKILNNGEMLPRITGLDPAGPCFHNVTAEDRLDISDAKFVDIIHTNIGMYGLNMSIGHVDFYPNGGGSTQPGCFESICSHNRVWMLYEESVNLPEAFQAVQCDSWDSFLEGQCAKRETTVMGFKTPTNVQGDYYLKTNKSPRFGMGTAGIVP